MNGKITCIIGEVDGPIEYLSYAYHPDGWNDRLEYNFTNHFNFRIEGGQVVYGYVFWVDEATDEARRYDDETIPASLRQQFEVIVNQPRFSEAVEQATLEAIDDLHQRLLALAAKTKLRPNGGDIGTTYRS